MRPKLVGFDRRVVTTNHGRAARPSGPPAEVEWLATGPAAPVPAGGWGKAAKDDVIGGARGPTAGGSWALLLRKTCSGAGRILWPVFTRAVFQSRPPDT